MNQMEKMKITRYSGTKEWFFLKEEIDNELIWSKKYEYGFNQQFRTRNEQNEEYDNENDDEDFVNMFQYYKNTNQFTKFSKF